MPRRHPDTGAGQLGLQAGNALAQRGVLEAQQVGDLAAVVAGQGKERDRAQEAAGKPARIGSMGEAGSGTLWSPGVSAAHPVSR